MEAKNGAAQLDLRQYAVKDTANRLMNSWEVYVSQKVTDTTQYEADCKIDLGSTGPDTWNSATSTL